MSAVATIKVKALQHKLSEGVYHHTVQMDGAYSIQTDLTRLPMRLAGMDVFPVDLSNEWIFALVSGGEGFNASEWRVVTLELCPSS